MQENAVQVNSSAEQVHSVGPQILTVGSHVPFTPQCVTNFSFSGLSDSGSDLADLLCFSADL